MSKAKQPVPEAVKALLRVTALGALAAAVGWAMTQITSLDPTSVWVIVGTPVLTAIDKWIHETDTTKLNGIVPF